MYDWSALPRGARAAIGVPGLVMAASFLGFGALVRSFDVGLIAGHMTTMFIWALPGQVVALDMLSSGAGLLTMALAVTLTAVRLLPMVVLVISKVRLDGARRLPLYALSHFVAVTIWRIAEDEIDQVERAQRLPWLTGLGIALMSSMLVMTTIGYYLAQSLPPLLAACLVFLTPAFFFISLFANAKFRMDYLAIAAGAVIGPVCHRYYPDLDLLAGGLIGGTLAYLATRWGRR
jgi:predicted branched-subunit amino acid permease